jgi:2,5-diketo-D-gluconate reductase A
MSELAPTLSLRNGADIPVLGIGTSPLQGAESATQVRTALEAGYRLIDTAENYRNEDAVGQAIRDSGIDRSEVFITTKFNRRWHGIDGARQAYESSLERLGVDYIDLLLLDSAP